MIGFLCHRPKSKEVEAEAEVEIEAEVGCCCTSAEKRDRYTRDYRHYRLQTTDYRLETADKIRPDCR